MGASPEVPKSLPSPLVVRVVGAPESDAAAVTCNCGAPSPPTALADWRALTLALAFRRPVVTPLACRPLSGPMPLVAPSSRISDPDRSKIVFVRSGLTDVHGPNVSCVGSSTMAVPPSANSAADSENEFCHYCALLAITS